jgi:hypothetical protein
MSKSRFSLRDTSNAAAAFRLAPVSARAFQQCYLISNRFTTANSDVLPFGRLWYGEHKRNQQRNRLRKVSQSLT